MHRQVNLSACLYVAAACQPLRVSPCPCLTPKEKEEEKNAAPPPCPRLPPAARSRTARRAAASPCWSSTLTTPARPLTQSASSCRPPSRQRWPRRGGAPPRPAPHTACRWLERPHAARRAQPAAPRSASPDLLAALQFSILPWGLLTASCPATCLLLPAAGRRAGVAAGAAGGAAGPAAVAGAELRQPAGVAAGRDSPGGEGDGRWEWRGGGE